MKLERGNYYGASECAVFDTPLTQMGERKLRALLGHILHQASPGADRAEATYRSLAIAEQCYREQEAGEQAAPQED